MGSEKHPHIPARQILDRIVLGGSDGVIESVAMTAALNGAGVPFSTILIAGLAFAVAGGTSMFFSTYLSRRSELHSLRLDIERERMEIETEPEEEKAELEKLLSEEGYGPGEVGVIMERLLKDKDMWLRAQLMHELRLHPEDLSSNPLSRPTAAGIAFLVLALATLCPYAFGIGRTAALMVSVVLSLLALFVLSSRLFTPKYFDLRSGLESAVVGGAAAGLLYALGLLAQGL